MELGFDTMNKVELDLSPLHEILHLMGGKPPQSITDKIQKKLETPDGIAIDIGDIAWTESGLLYYVDSAGHQHHGTLYIKDHSRLTRISGRIFPSNRNRIHIFRCKTLDEMIAAGRKHRYHFSSQKNHLRTIELRRGKEEESELLICWHCLKHWNLLPDTNTPKNKLRSNFPFSKFFEQHRPQFNLKDYKSPFAPVPGYPREWSMISRRYREKQNWRCECCGVDLNKRKDLLDAHHITADKSGKLDADLEALCKLCHKQQPWHSFKISEEDRETILRLRREQNLPENHRDQSPPSLPL